MRWVIAQACNRKGEVLDIQVFLQNREVLPDEISDNDSIHGGSDAASDSDDDE